MDHEHDRLRVRRRERMARIRQAGEALATTISHASRENGNVSWPREVTIAQQKVDEAVMWALRMFGPES